MNLYSLHKKPKSLDHHKDAHDAVVHLFWNKYKDNPTELKKREKSIATSAEYSLSYATDILKGPFKLGEKAISKNGVYSFIYAYKVLKSRFKEGELAIEKNETYWNFYKREFLS